MNRVMLEFYVRGDGFGKVLTRYLLFLAGRVGLKHQGTIKLLFTSKHHHPRIRILIETDSIYAWCAWWIDLQKDVRDRS